MKANVFAWNSSLSDYELSKEIDFIYTFSSLGTDEKIDFLLFSLDGESVNIYISKKDAKE